LKDKLKNKAENDVSKDDIFDNKDGEADFVRTPNKSNQKRLYDAPIMKKSFTGKYLESEESEKSLRPSVMKQITSEKIFKNSNAMCSPDSSPEKEGGSPEVMSEVTPRMSKGKSGK
jgi:hypothetical protein